MTYIYHYIDAIGLISMVNVKINVLVPLILSNIELSFVGIWDTVNDGVFIDVFEKKGVLDTLRETNISPHFGKENNRLKVAAREGKCKVPWRVIM